MKKHILIIAALIVAAFSLNAKTIHWVTFIDTTDPRVGKYDVLGREVLYNHYINLVNAALDEKGYKYAIHDFYGARTSPENCKKIVQSLQTEPDDLIMFYYIGHGGRAVNDLTRWPQMCLAQHEENKLVPLNWVHETLKSKPHRLLVTIGMCCNSLDKDITPKAGPTFAANYGNTYMSDEAVENIAKLFLGVKGDLILSSSSAKESSYPIGIEQGGIDIFTYTLALAFESLMEGGVNPDWNSLFSGVGSIVTTQIKRLYNKSQTPQWEQNLQAANVPGNSVPQRSEEPAPSREDVQKQSETTGGESTDERDETINWLNTVFNMILDNRRSDEERIEMAEGLLENLQANQLQVRTLGQDGNTIVGRQNLEDFVGRLATSRVMRGVSVADFNNAGIFVREIYQQ